MNKKALFCLFTLGAACLSGCSGAEIAGAAGALGGAFMGYQKIKHPVSNAIAENPTAFWGLAGQIVAAIIAVITLAHKAGKDHKDGSD